MINMTSYLRKELLTTMTRLRLESLVRLWWVFSILLFDSNPSNHNSRGEDWLLWHFILSYEIKYIAGRLYCIRSKSQQLWLIRFALDRGETCSDELLVAWFFQVQQICRQKQPTGARNQLPYVQRTWATPRTTEFNPTNTKFNKS